MTVSDSHLPKPSVGADPRVRVRVYALTDVGHTRDHNEDTYLVADLEHGDPVDFDGASKELSADAHGLLFLVADGMGGAASGALASGMAGQVVLNTLRASWKSNGALSEAAFATARVEAKKEKDEIAAKYVNEFVEKEWAAISPANLKNQAYFGGGITRVSDSSGFEGQENLFPPIVKVNPEYWNKNLPKSAISFNSI